MSWASIHASAQITWDFAEPIPVAGEEFGNRCPRLVLDAAGNPMVLMGKSGEGLFLATSNNGVFNTPLPIPTLDNVFMADAEGPSIAVHGSTLGFGLPSVRRMGDRRAVHEHPRRRPNLERILPHLPNATEDHFMPMLAFDDDGNPFVAVKFGDDPMVVEGVMRSTDGGQTFQPAQPASADVGSGLACECCPSKTIFGHGRYYSVYRQNDENLRDMRLVSSEDGATWDHQLDLDPTDWVISACPETGASLAWLPDGRLALHLSGAQATAPQGLRQRERHWPAPCQARWAPRSPSPTSSKPATGPTPHRVRSDTHRGCLAGERRWLGNSRRILDQRRPPVGDCPTQGEPISTSLSGSNLHPRSGHPRLQGSCHLEEQRKRSGDVPARHLRRCRTGGIWRGVRRVSESPRPRSSAH